MISFVIRQKFWHWQNFSSCNLYLHLLCAWQWYFNNKLSYKERIGWEEGWSFLRRRLIVFYFLPTPNNKFIAIMLSFNPETIYCCSSVKKKWLVGLSSFKKYGIGNENKAWEKMSESSVNSQKFIVNNEKKKYSRIKSFSFFPFFCYYSYIIWNLKFFTQLFVHLFI